MLLASSAFAADLIGGEAFRFPSRPSSIGFAGDGLAALTVEDQIVALSLPDGARGAVRQACEYPAHFAPHGDRVAMTCGYERLVMLAWPALTPLASVPYQDGELVWSADGSSLALAGGDGITFFDRSLRKIGNVPGLRVYRLAGRGDTWVVGGQAGDDGAEGAFGVRLDGTRRWSMPGWSGALALSGDGRRVVVGRQGGAAVLDSATGQELGAWTRDYAAPSGTVWTTGGWWVDDEGGRQRVDDQGHTLGRVDARGDVLVSADGRVVVSDVHSPVPRLWSADGVPSHADPVDGSVVDVVGSGTSLSALTDRGALLDLVRGKAHVRATLVSADSVAAGPGGELAVVADGTVHRIDARGGDEVVPLTLDEDEWIVVVRYGADGEPTVVTNRGARGPGGALQPFYVGDAERVMLGPDRWVISEDSVFRVLDRATGRTLSSGSDGEIWGLGLRPDGAVVVGATRERYDSDELRVAVVPGPAPEPWDLCCTLAVAPDGRFVAAAGDAPEVRAYDPVRRTLLATWPAPGRVDRLWIPRPDVVVAQLLDGRLAVIDAAALPPPPGGPPPRPNLPPGVLAEVPGDFLDGGASWVGWTASGRALRLGGYAVDEIDPRTGVVHTLVEEYGWLHAAATADGLVVSTKSDDGWRLRRLGPDGDEVWAVPTGGGDLVEVGGGRVLVTTDRAFEVRDVATGSVRWTGPRGARPLGLSGDGSRVAAIVDGAIAVFAGSDGASAEAVPVREPCSVAWAPDGRRIAVSDRSSRTWITRPGSDLVPLDGVGSCPGLAFSPDGALVATRNDRELVIWDASTGRALRGWTLGDGREIAWGPRGVVTSDGDGIRLFDPR